MSEQLTKKTKTEVKINWTRFVIPPCSHCGGKGTWRDDPSEWYDIYEIDPKDPALTFKCPNKKCPVNLYDVNIEIIFEGEDTECAESSSDSE